MSAVYPWSAVVGQEPLKLALLLSAIDPALGGVLLTGPRGVAKTTLARALAELVPGKFVELPLGASEERVTGSLDLDAALRDGRVAFAPGLLARAHEGVLYVDEVNLLPDALVDLLLDAAASGRNTVERDGISHSHDARFVLVGTMNPDEGELRPQLMDRFGLAVHADADIAPAQRGEIVRRRLAFDSDRTGFALQYAAEQRVLAERCQRARQRAANIPLAGSALEHVSERCYAAGVEGVRADLAMLRAARAHAAWHERDEITTADVDAVAELALAHRRRAKGEPPRSGPGSSSAGARGNGTEPGGTRTAGTTRSSDAHASKPPGRPPSREASGDSAPRGQDVAEGGGESGSGGRGALLPVAVAATAPPFLPAWLFTTRPRDAEPRRRGRALLGSTRGQGGKDAGARGSIDWFATLARCPKPRRGDLCHRERRAPPRALFVLAVDCSSSMLRHGALATAKGVARAFEQRALRSGAHVVLISFRGTGGAEAGVFVTKAKRTLGPTIADLGAGGGTPLASAVREAVALCAQRPWHGTRADKHLVLLTDGRTRERLDPLSPACADLSVVVIDCERGPVRLGRAASLASALRGRYLHVDTLC